MVSFQNRPQIVNAHAIRRRVLLHDVQCVFLIAKTKGPQVDAVEHQPRDTPLLHVRVEHNVVGRVALFVLLGKLAQPLGH
jgi:hypothetical protein